MIPEGGTTSYQCLDCGQARTGEECRTCKDFEIARSYWKEKGASNSFEMRLLFAFDFQKARAERAERKVNCLRAAIERHRELYLTDYSLLDYKTTAEEELWAALEPPLGDTEER